MPLGRLGGGALPTAYEGETSRIGPANLDSVEICSKEHRTEELDVVRPCPQAQHAQHMADSPVRRGTKINGDDASTQLEYAAHFYESMSLQVVREMVKHHAAQHDVKPVCRIGSASIVPISKRALAPTRAAFLRASSIISGAGSIPQISAVGSTVAAAAIVRRPVRIPLREFAHRHNGGELHDFSVKGRASSEGQQARSEIVKAGPMNGMALSSGALITGHGYRCSVLQSALTGSLFIRAMRRRSRALVSASTKR